jgi:hypothetical protein
MPQTCRRGLLTQMQMPKMLSSDRGVQYAVRNRMMDPHILWKMPPVQVETHQLLISGRHKNQRMGSDDDVD